MITQNNKFDIQTTKGDTVAFSFEIDGIDEVASAYFSVKKGIDDTEYALQKSLNDGIVLISAGVYTVRISPDDTSSLPLGMYYYDLQIGVQNGDNVDIYTILKGFFDISFEITKEG